MDQQHTDIEESPSTPIVAGSPSYKKVLCIEDENFISELYTRALTKAGYVVTVASDGAEGLAKAKTNEFDIILLDIMLPNIIGTDILDQLRGPGLSLKAKIVITTNLEQKEKVRAAIEQQADGYIVKAEVTPKQLVQFLGHFESPTN